MKKEEFVSSLKITFQCSTDAKLQLFLNNTDNIGQMIPMFSLK